MSIGKSSLARAASAVASIDKTKAEQQPAAPVVDAAVNTDEPVLTIGMALSGEEQPAPKKRGRKPKAQQPETAAAAVTEQPKKRGRKPGAQPTAAEAAAAAPSKRGRKPKAEQRSGANAASYGSPSQPKKRGRKPKSYAEAAPTMVLNEELVPSAEISRPAKLTPAKNPQTDTTPDPTYISIGDDLPTHLL